MGLCNFFRNHIKDYSSKAAPLHNLRGQKFILFTDHKPLEKLGKVHTKTLHRIQQAMLEYDFEIHYKKGAEMPADYLSHNVCSVLPVQEQLDLKNEQIKDPQLGIILKFLKTGTPRQRV